MRDSIREDFRLDDWDPPVPVQLPEGLTREQLLNFRPFKDWNTTLKDSLRSQKYSSHPFHSSPYTVRYINVQAFDKFVINGKEKLLFVKLFALVENKDGEDIPGVVFLRGGSVAVLMILKPADNVNERYVVMTEQSRVAAGSLTFMEIPAGMLDDEYNFAGAAAREIEEEVGLKIKASELIDMTKHVIQRPHKQENLQHAMYPSPGACDEFISLFLWEKEIERARIEELKGKLTGERAEQEKITVRLLKYESLLEYGARDGKTLAAWSLYEYLQRTRDVNKLLANASK
jgi:8-oxo-dGTP pyrophosphatase MutT (NUDIX family)